MVPRGGLGAGCNGLQKDSRGNLGVLLELFPIMTAGVYTSLHLSRQIVLYITRVNCNICKF